MARYQIERGRNTDFVLVGGVPAGVITRGPHGRAVSCTIEGQRTQGANGECRPGEHPTWIAKHARRAGLVGGRRALGAAKRRAPYAPGDAVTMSRLMRTIQPMQGRPWVTHDTPLVVKHVEGTGARTNPYRIATVLRDGDPEMIFWFAVDDVTPADAAVGRTRGRGLRAARRSAARASAPARDQAYRGYLIKSTSNGQLSIAKDGFHIGYARDVDDAKRSIDMLVD